MIITTNEEILLHVIASNGRRPGTLESLLQEQGCLVPGAPDWRAKSTEYAVRAWCRELVLPYPWSGEKAPSYIGVHLYDDPSAVKPGDFVLVGVPCTLPEPAIAISTPFRGTFFAMDGWDDGIARIRKWRMDFLSEGVRLVPAKGYELRKDRVSK